MIELKSGVNEQKVTDMRSFYKGDGGQRKIVLLRSIFLRKKGDIDVFILIEEKSD